MAKWLEDDDIHQLHPGRQSAARLIVIVGLDFSGLSDWKASKKHHMYILTYIPRTQMGPLVLDDWTHKMEGQTLKIEVSWVPGI